MWLEPKTRRYTFPSSLWFRVIACRGSPTLDEHKKNLSHQHLVREPRPDGLCAAPGPTL